MSLSALVLEFLDQEGWPYEELKTHGAFRVQIDGNTGRWPCIAVKNEAEDQLVVYGVCPFPVIAERRIAMAELLTRANFGLPTGSFELDLDDGELRFRTSIDFEDAVIDPKLIRNLFYINVAVMDQHLPALEALVAGLEPKQALGQIRQPI